MIPVANISGTYEAQIEFQNSLVVKSNRLDAKTAFGRAQTNPTKVVGAFIKKRRTRISLTLKHKPTEHEPRKIQDLITHRNIPVKMLLLVITTMITFISGLIPVANISGTYEAQIEFQNSLVVKSNRLDASSLYKTARVWNGVLFNREY